MGEFFGRKRAGFTLVEIAIVLVLIGLLIGLGAALVGPLTKRIKINETRESIDSAVESVLGFATAMKRLPNGDEFKTIIRKTHDSWNKELRYVAWSNFTSSEKNVICPSNATSYGFKVKVVTATGNRTIDNVAFLIMSSGPNYNLQTRFDNGNNTVWYISDKNTEITIYAPGTQNIDDHHADGNRPEEYDDLVKWVTVYELMQKACNTDQTGDEGPLRILTYNLPTAYQNVPYSAEIIAVGGVKPYQWTTSLSPDPNGLSASSPQDILIINGTPKCPGTFSISATVKDSRDNTASRTFTLTVQPDPLVFSPTSGTTFYATNGTPFSTNVTISGGKPPYNSTCNPTACLGLSCTASSGTIMIYGTPSLTSSSSQTCNFNVHVTDSCKTATANYAVVIQPASGGGSACTPMSLSPLSGTTWSAVVGTAFSQTITVTGGNGTRTNTQCIFSETSSSNCRGLSISCNSNGATISGTPSSAGPCSAQVSWRDSCSPTPQTTTGTYIVNISTPTCSSMSLNPPSGSSFTYTEGESVNINITLNGGYSPKFCNSYNFSCSGAPNLSATCDGNGARITGQADIIYNSPVTCSFSGTWRDSCPNGVQWITGSYTIQIQLSPKALVNKGTTTVYYQTSSDSTCKEFGPNYCLLLNPYETVNFYRVRGCAGPQYLCTYTYNTIRSTDSDKDNHVGFIYTNQCSIFDITATQPCF